MPHSIDNILRAVEAVRDQLAQRAARVPEDLTTTPGMAEGSSQARVAAQSDAVQQSFAGQPAGAPGLFNFASTSDGPASASAAATPTTGPESEAPVLNTLDSSWDEMAAASDDGPQDRLTVEDLDVISANEDGRFSQSEVDAANYLLENPHFLTRLDVAADDDGRGDPDGEISRDDVEAVRADQDPIDPSLIQTPEDALSVVDRDFVVFDTADQGDLSLGDDEIHREDLEVVAHSPEYTAEQAAAAQYLQIGRAHV